MFVETIAYIEAVHVGLMLPHYENTNVVDDEQYAEFVYDRIINYIYHKNTNIVDDAWTIY